VVFWVYILRCADGSYYTGHTDNLSQRIGEHQAGICPGYTANRLPVELAWSQECSTREEALTAELQIKGWARRKKEAMMRGDWKDVALLAKKNSARDNHEHRDTDKSIHPSIRRHAPTQGERTKILRSMMNQSLTNVIRQAEQVIAGKPQQIRLALACLLARGHLLIEDMPGVGKTTLAHVLARTLGMEFQRIQFTSDLLPADILGVSVYQRDSNDFKFHPGPIFAQMILADEVNRATPKAQSALLEAMEERQVTIEGTTRPLPVPFFVIATQNPAYQVGTFPLPESQLDRFMMRIRMGYPDPQAERGLLSGVDRREIVAQLKPQMESAELLALQQRVREVFVSPALLDYIQAILRHTREAARYAHGLSPRAGLALLAAARAWALIGGRNAVLPEDVQAVLPGVVSHRLQTAGERANRDGDALARELIGAVAIP
jgi:MoxR-like ATPase